MSDAEDRVEAAWVALGKDIIDAIKSEDPNQWVINELFATHRPLIEAALAGRDDEPDGYPNG